MSFGKLRKKQGKIDEILKNNKKVTKSSLVPCGIFGEKVVIFEYFPFWTPSSLTTKSPQFSQPSFNKNPEKGEFSINLSSNDTHNLHYKPPNKKFNQFSISIPKNNFFKPLNSSFSKFFMN